MKKIFLISILAVSPNCFAVDYTEPGYEEGSAINQDTVRDQWQEMRDQPALTETSGIYDPVQEFFKINTKRVKPVAKSKLAKGKKGKKIEMLDEASKEPSLAAESKIDGKPNLDTKPSLDAKPRSTERKAKSADGSTQSEY